MLTESQLTQTRAALAAIPALLAEIRATVGTTYDRGGPAQGPATAAVGSHPPCDLTYVSAVQTLTRAVGTVIGELDRACKDRPVPGFDLCGWLVYTSPWWAGTWWANDRVRMPVLGVLHDLRRHLRLDDPKPRPAATETLGAMHRGGAGPQPLATIARLSGVPYGTLLSWHHRGVIAPCGTTDDGRPTFDLGALAQVVRARADKSRMTQPVRG